VNRVNGIPIKVKEEPRRAGDPPALIAKAEKARSLLKWEPRYDDLDFIVKTSLDWERKLLARQ
jgi:UDP-glucose 4-epimerase